MTNTIFTFISSLGKEAIFIALTIFLSKYQLNELSHVESVLCKFPFNRIQGLCYTIKLIIKHLGRLIDDKISYIGKMIIAILKLSLTYYTAAREIKGSDYEEMKDIVQENNNNEVEGKNQIGNVWVKTSHTIYSEAIKRLKEIYNQYYETPYLDEITNSFIGIVTSKIQRMKLELSQSKSNLLSIFLIWSSNPKYLHRYFNSSIFNAIISLLTAPKVVPEVVSLVIEILFNLLFAEEVSPCTKLIEDNVDTIISSLHFYLESKGAVQDVKTLAVLRELARHVKSNNMTIQKLIELLEPNLFVAMKLPKKKQGMILELVRTLKALFEIYKGNNKKEYFQKLSRLLLRIKGCVIRREIAELLFTLLPTNKYSKVILNMNSYTRVNMELESDFDVIIKEMNEFNSFLESKDSYSISLSEIRVVLYQYLAYLSNEDYSLRSVACHGLNLFLTGRYKNSFKVADEEIKEFMVNDFLLTIIRAMKIRDDVIFRNVMEVIRSYLVNSIEAPNEYKEEPKMYLDLLALTKAKDEEQDFFHNISHTQIHRRFKALRNATIAVEEKKVSVESALKVLLPLAESFLLQDNDEEVMRKKVMAFKSSGYSRQTVTDAIELIGAITPQLSTEQYMKLINRYITRFKKLRSYREITQGVIINILCKVLDNYPFIAVNADQFIEHQVTQSKDPVEALKKLEKEEIKDELLMYLKRSVFPVLKNAMVESKKSRDKEGERHKDVRPHIALALLRIAKKLGAQKYLEEFEKVITILVVPLRSREYELRDKVRSVFYEIIEASTPFVLHIILKELSLGLTKDHQRYVLLYTIHGIFQRIVKTQKERFYSKVDYCLHLILPLVMKGLIGELAEDAETEEVIRQCKEAKNLKAAELYGLLAQLILLKDSLDELIKPLVEQLEIAKNTKQIHKCEAALGKVSEGILKNSGLGEEILIDLCRRMIEAGFTLFEKKEEVEQRRIPIYKTLYEHKAENFLIQEGAAGGKRLELFLPKNVKNEHLSGKALCFFGLSMLHSGISRQLVKLPRVLKINKKTKLTFGSNEQEEPMIIEDTWIDNFVPFLLKALKTPQSQIVQMALRIYDKLLDQNIPSLQSQASEFLDCVIKQFDYMNLSHEEMVQSVFKCVTRIIETSHSTLSLGKHQKEALLTLIKTNMREAERQVPVFKCVRAIVNLKEKIKGVIEIMDYVSELMISGRSKSIRETCGATFIDYVTKVLKIDSQTFKNKVNFLLHNLSYEDTDSRLYLVEILFRIVNYIIEKEQWQWIDTLFVTLVLQMANEDSAKCKKKILELIEFIMKSSPYEVQKQIVGSIFVWIKEDKKLLKMVCFQLIGIVVKIWKDSFISHLEATLEQILNTLRDSVNQMQEETAQDNEKVHEEIKGIMTAVKLIEPEENVEDRSEWTLCYMSLICLEKLFENIKGHVLNHLKEQDEIMNLISELLLHRHYWIKLLACRIIGHYFSDRNPLENNICFFRDGNSKELATKLLTLFKSKYLDNQLATQTTKNLLFIVKNTSIAHYIMQKATNMGKPAISGPKEERNKLNYLLTLIAGVAYGMSVEELKEEASLSLSLAYRIATDERYKGSDTARQASDIMKLIEGLVGVETYTQRLNKLKGEIQKMRLGRKEKQRQIKLTNPEAAMKQKIKAKEKGKEKRRKKNTMWAIKRKGAILPENNVVVKKFKAG